MFSVSNLFLSKIAHVMIAEKCIFLLSFCKDKNCITTYKCFAKIFEQSLKTATADSISALRASFSKIVIIKITSKNSKQFIITGLLSGA